MHRIRWTALVLGVSACTHALSARDLESRAGEEGTVYARNGRWHKARLVAGPDGPRFQPLDGSPPIEYVEVDHVTFPSEARGGWDGLLIGLLTGAVGGTLIGLGTWDEDSYLPQGQAIAVGAVAFGVLGGLGGIAVGAQVGATYRHDPAPAP